MVQSFMMACKEVGEKAPYPGRRSPEASQSNDVVSDIQCEIENKTSLPVFTSSSLALQTDDIPQG